jgi:hypothetical protein
MNAISKFFAFLYGVGGLLFCYFIFKFGTDMMHANGMTWGQFLGLLWSWSTAWK